MFDAYKIQSENTASLSQWLNVRTDQLRDLHVDSFIAIFPRTNRRWNIAAQIRPFSVISILALNDLSADNGLPAWGDNGNLMLDSGMVLHAEAEKPHTYPGSGIGYGLFMFWKKPA